MIVFWLVAGALVTIAILALVLPLLGRGGSSKPVVGSEVNYRSIGISCVSWRRIERPER